MTDVGQGQVKLAEMMPGIGLWDLPYRLAKRRTGLDSLPEKKSRHSLIEQDRHAGRLLLPKLESPLAVAPMPGQGRPLVAQAGKQPRWKNGLCSVKYFLGLREVPSQAQQSGSEQ